MQEKSEQLQALSFLGTSAETDDATNVFESDGNSLTAMLMSQKPAAPELMNDFICICPPNSCH